MNAVRLNSFGSLKKVREYYTNILSGYIDVGIEKESEDYGKAIEILSSNNLPRNLLIDHSLNGGFQRIPVSNRARIKSLSLQQIALHAGKKISIPVQLTAEQLKAIDTIYDLYSQDDNLKKNNMDLFMTEWDKRSNLRVLREWWDNISMTLSITSVGKVLAHSNAQRCDKSLPPLN